MEVEPCGGDSPWGFELANQQCVIGGGGVRNKPQTNIWDSFLRRGDSLEICESNCIHALQRGKSSHDGVTKISDKPPISELERMVSKTWLHRGSVAYPWATLARKSSLSSSTVTGSVGASGGSRGTLLSSAGGALASSAGAEAGLVGRLGTVSEGSVKMFGAVSGRAGALLLLLAFGLVGRL